MMENSHVNAKLKDFLEHQLLLVAANLDDFLALDPVLVPQQFSKKEDIEISAFLTAIIAWGQRKSILNNAQKLMRFMEYQPHDFILNHSTQDLKPLEHFVHRTFNADDLLFFLARLQRMYRYDGGLEHCMVGNSNQGISYKLSHFKILFFDNEYLARSKKHLADPLKGSTAKRLLMFLRWMVRDDLADFGCWKSLSPAQLMAPIDVHSAYFAREMGLLTRKQNDWKAVEELSQALGQICPEDPVKYDYVLYGMGAFSFFRPLSDLRL